MKVGTLIRNAINAGLTIDRTDVLAGIVRITCSCERQAFVLQTAGQSDVPDSLARDVLAACRCRCAHE